MGFEKIQQWRRHQATIAVDAATSAMRLQCVRCGVELPMSLMPGAIVLSKEDRLLIGDDPRAENCR